MKEERSGRKVATANALTAYLRLIRARRGSIAQDPSSRHWTGSVPFALLELPRVAKNADGQEPHPASDSIVNADQI